MADVGGGGAAALVGHVGRLRLRQEEVVGSEGKQTTARRAPRTPRWDGLVNRAGSHGDVMCGDVTVLLVKGRDLTEQRAVCGARSDCTVAPGEIWCSPLADLIYSDKATR